MSIKKESNLHREVEAENKPTPFRFLWSSALRWPRTVLLLVLLPTIWLAVQARHLRLEASIDLLSANDPLSLAEELRRERFGADFRILLALYKSEDEGGVLGIASQEALIELHRKLETLPGVRRVASLVNAPALVDSPGSPAGTPIWPDSQPAASELWEPRLAASEVGRRLLLSDRKSLMPLYLEIESGASEATLVRQIRRLAVEVEARHPEAGEVLVVGPGVVETTLADHIFDDLTGLVPFSILVILAGLLLALRRGVFVVIALVHSAALIAVLLGGMAWVGSSVNLISVLAPVILIPVGVADLLHLFVRLGSGLDTGPEPRGRSALLASAFAHLERPMVGTSATTAIGFLGFLMSPIPAMRQFGLTMSAGATAALVIAFTLDAALLALFFKPPRHRADPRPCRIERWLLARKAPSGTLRYRSTLPLMTCIYIACAGLLSLPALRIRDTWIQNFDPGSEIVHDTQLFEAEFLGTNVLSLVFEADPSAPRQTARVLDAVNAVTTTLALVPGIEGVLSATLLGRSLDPLQGPVWSAWPTPSAARMSESHDAWQRRGLALPRWRMLADPDFNRFQLQAFFVNQPYGALVSRISWLEDLAERAIDGSARLTTGGNLAVNVKMVRLAVVGQARSLALVLAVITLLAVAFTRSVVAGIVLVLPMVLSILGTTAVLVVAKIPCGIAVSMFPTLVVGLSVDFAIHVREGLRRNRHAADGRWAREMASVLRGILLNGMVWSAGFAVLVASDLPPNRYLGLLSSIVVCLSMAVTLLLLPAMTRWGAGGGRDRPRESGSRRARSGGKTSRVMA